jgi:hypothetical protein
MRKFVQPLSAIAGMLLALGACADSPTAGSQPHDLATAEAPLLDQTISGCVGDRDGVCMLDPVIVDPYCDPWMSLDWCEGDDCAYSDTAATGPEFQATMGCGEPREPRDPGVYKPAPKPCPDYGCPPPPPDTCRTGEATVDDTDVSGQFDALWQQSIAQGVEMGGWIVLDGPNNYRLIPFQNSVNTSCGVDIWETPPANLVSMLHTHPWSLGQTRVCDGALTMYTGTPSPEDTQALRQLGLSTGYFIDHAGIGKYTATGGEAATRIKRCGY